MFFYIHIKFLYSFHQLDAEISSMLSCEFDFPSPAAATSGGTSGSGVMDFRLLGVDEDEDDDDDVDGDGDEEF